MKTSILKADICRAIARTTVLSILSLTLIPGLIKAQPLSGTSSQSAGKTASQQATVQAAQYAAWRQQRFGINDFPVGNPKDRPLMMAAVNTPPSNKSFGSLIGLNQAFVNYDYRGQGYAVAVIDTGIDYKHLDLGGGWGKRVIAGWDFVNNDSDPMDDQGHGTHVAGIIASSSQDYSGVAPGANLIALKVLDNSGSGSYGAVEDALKWVQANQAKYNIVAVNLSLGAGNFQTLPDNYKFLSEEFDAIRSQGIFISVASGNAFYGYNSAVGLAFPAIDPRVVSVGAVWNGSFGAVPWLSGARDNTTAPDRIASFSQRSTDLDIMAPGALINSTYLNNKYQSMAGTSMAAPVVAGAAVLLRQAFDRAGAMSQADQEGILSLMKYTGKTVVDGDDEDDNVVNTKHSFKRLDLLSAFQFLGSTKNEPPILKPIANQKIIPGKDLIVGLEAQDANKDPISFSVKLLNVPAAGTNPAFTLKQTLGLTYSGSYYQNSWGKNEKWLSGSGNLYYMILPNGELRRWAGKLDLTLTSAYLVASLSTDIYNDPSLLWNANPENANPVKAIISGNNLILQTNAVFTGSFQVEVTASDGKASAKQKFEVASAQGGNPNPKPTPTPTPAPVNSPPVLKAIPEQAVKPGAKILITLDATDPNNDPIQYTASLVKVQASGVNPAYKIKQDLSLTYLGSYYPNAWGKNEKWMSGANQSYYMILPNGELRRWAGTMAATSSNANLITVLQVDYYNDPSLLWDAKATVLNPVTLQISGKVVTVKVELGFVGSIQVKASASDGKLESSQIIDIAVSQ